MVLSVKSRIIIDLSLSFNGPLGLVNPKNSTVFQNFTQKVHLSAFFSFLPNIELSRVCEDLVFLLQKVLANKCYFLKEVVDNIQGIY